MLQYITNKNPIHLTVLISSLTIGGAEQLLLELLKNIDRRRFNISIVFLRNPGLLGQEFLQLGFKVKTDIIHTRFDPLGTTKLARVLAAEKTEVLLLINHLNTLFFGVLSAKIARVPVCINWANETFKKYPFHFLTMLGRRLLHMGIDGVVAAAKGHKAYIASVEKVPYRKIVTIYNGVDPRRFSSPLSAASARKKLNIPISSPVISIIAVLRPDKAHEDFLEAACVVLKAVPEAHFLIIGDGPRRHYLINLTQTLQIQKNVHFLGFQRKLGDILAAVDINILASKPEQETLSVAAIEAMSVGIPIICTNVGFMKEIVFPGKTGFIVNVGDPQGLAEKIIMVLNNKALAEKMGLKAKTFVHQHLTIKQMASNFENLFFRMVAQKHS